MKCYMCMPIKVIVICTCTMYMYIMVEGKGLSRILSRDIVAGVGTRADVCALIGTPVRIQPVYVYTTIHT